VAQPSHIPVLAERLLDILSPRPGDTVLDCTAGGGGHAVLLARAIGQGGTLILNDLDEGNLRRARERVEREAAPESGGAWEGRIICLHGNFAAAPRRIVELATGAGGAPGQADGGDEARGAKRGGVDVLLADLGFESGQIEDASRGLAFSREGPLDMRYDRSRGPTAADLVNTLPVRELAEVIRDYGEEPHGVARRIAEKLVRERDREPIQTTARFAQIVREAVGGGGRTRSGKIDAATRTFQALRIAVNDELSALDALLEHIERAARALRLPEGAQGRGAWLNPGARVGIIAFHSLEDRRVKRAFAGLIEQHAAVHLTHRPVEADEAERRLNPRSRSARFRAVRLGP
jgi:16S rRNA (cytosine1402-N4)-methyltransferase